LRRRAALPVILTMCIGQGREGSITEIMEDKKRRAAQGGNPETLAAGSN